MQKGMILIQEKPLTFNKIKRLLTNAFIVKDLLC